MMTERKKSRRSGKPVGKQKFDRASLDRLAEVFGAFADGTRLALLQELMSGPKSVNELLAVTGTTQANVSRQLKILHRVGLLSREQAGLFVIYTIADDMVLDMCNIACRKLSRTPPPAPVPKGFV